MEKKGKEKELALKSFFLKTNIDDCLGIKYLRS